MSAACRNPDPPGEKREAERVEAALATAGIGTWGLDLATRSHRWSASSLAIPEIKESRQPSPAEALVFCAPEARPRLAAAVAAGAAWDLELPFITARGRHIWLRTTGRRGCERRALPAIWSAPSPTSAGTARRSPA